MKKEYVYGKIDIKKRLCKYDDRKKNNRK